MEKTGTVKFFNYDKGFGFITPENGGQDIFVHITGVEGGTLNDGDKVTYIEGQGKKGSCAEQVHVI